MKFEEINKRFTEQVAQYIAKGYVFNTATMSGHQGEIAKVDLTNGKEIIRVTLETTNGYEDLGDNKWFWYAACELRVGRYTDNIKPHSNETMMTLWTDKMEVIFSEQFYKVREYGRCDWYVTREEAIKASDVRHSRYMDKKETKVYPEKAKKAVLSFVRRQPKCKTAGLDEIEKVMKTVRYELNGERVVSYTVECRGHKFFLH